jgi:hypothetical protein
MSLSLQLTEEDDDTMLWNDIRMVADRADSWFISFGSIVYKFSTHCSSQYHN